MLINNKKSLCFYKIVEFQRFYSVKQNSNKILRHKDTIILSEMKKLMNALLAHND